MKNLVGILSALGAINWILFGLFDWNLFEEVFRIKLLITIKISQFQNLIINYNIIKIRPLFASIKLIGYILINLL